MTKTSTAKTPAAKSKAARKTAATKAKAAKKGLSKPSTHKLIWRDITCRVKHTPNYISKGWSHLEIMVVAPNSAPLPITGTGYRSHFLDADLIAKAGGPVTFFQCWLDSEATTKAWAKAEFKWRQGDLFK
jgi:hypothetical protein